MTSATTSLRKRRSGQVPAPHVLTSQSHVLFTSALHKSIFAQYSLFSVHTKMGNSTGTEHPPASNIRIVKSIKPCIWEEAHWWHRLRLEEHIFPQMSGCIWQRKIGHCSFTFMWFFPAHSPHMILAESVTQPPVKLGGKTRADGPHLMLSDCIHPSIILQFLQMSSLRKTLHIIAHMQTLDTHIISLCHQLPPQDSMWGPMYFTITLTVKKLFPIS